DRQSRRASPRRYAPWSYMKRTIGCAPRWSELCIETTYKHESGRIFAAHERVESVAIVPFVHKWCRSCTIRVTAARTTHALERTRKIEVAGASRHHDGAFRTLDFTTRSCRLLCLRDRLWLGHTRRQP